MLLLLLTCLSTVILAQYMMPYGGGCGGCPRPACAPPTPCTPMCPPPPPQFCPPPLPPPICPPPPPPMICAPPPPPPPCPCSMARPMYYPMPYQSYGGCGGGAIQSYGGGGCGSSSGCGAQPMPIIPAQNDCCCGCSSPCRYKGRARKAAGVKTVDPACNNEELRKIITELISEDASESKRTIQGRAEQALGHMVNVICGKGEFSYIAHTETFCQATTGDVTCYAFKPI